MEKVVISGSGLYVPPNVITNDELAQTFKQYVDQYNKAYEAEIAAGKLSAQKESTSDFFIKAAGIKQRYVVEKTGILDPELMRPIVPQRAHDELSIQGEMGVWAAKQALEKANKQGQDVDFILMASSNIERSYPALAIEMQHALGAKGYAFDMNAACSSITFGIQTIVDAIRGGRAKCALLVCVELGSCWANFCDRDSHFLFGDAAVALVIEAADFSESKNSFEYIESKLITNYSNNIIHDLSFINRLDLSAEHIRSKLFRQKGKQVFKEVVTLASDFIVDYLSEANLSANQLKRMWLHQANINMNQLIAEKVLGTTATQEIAPIILDRYGNTAAAGSVIAFHHFHEDLNAGDWGLLCSFGAGYTLGGVLLRRM